MQFTNWQLLVGLQLQTFTEIYSQLSKVIQGILSVNYPYIQSTASPMLHNWQWWERNAWTLLLISETHRNVTEKRVVITCLTRRMSNSQSKTVLNYWFEWILHSERQDWHKQNRSLFWNSEYNYAIKTRVNKLKYPWKLLNNNLQIQCQQFANRRSRWSF